jgi:outer membrane protein OmpA-like peptidoglycan-associated protein
LKTRLFIILGIYLFVLNITYSQTNDTISLFYILNEHTLSNNNKTKIDALLNFDQITSVEIKGYADFTGSKTYNDTLSFKRANTVKNYLLARDFSENKIVYCKGLGVHPNSSSKNRIDLNDKGIAEHRKVEIIFMKKMEEEIVDVTEDNLELESEPLLLEKEDFEIGNKLVLNNIIFYGGTSLIKAESESVMKELVELLKTHRNLIIEIQGHICCQTDGKDGYDMINKNYNLSENRAKAVYEYLIKKGIKKERMTYKGYGSSQKRYPDEINEEEENLNRRVEIMIVGK